MNAKIDKTINGQRVSARPIFKDGIQPAYWAATINERTLAKQFASPTEAFHFAAHKRGARR
ncbi:MAG: hypothetical protein WCZ87_03675 [Thiohalobacteraceae bacterium]